MTQRDKTLSRWERSTDETFSTVEAMLKYKGFTLEGSAGSHNIYSHPALEVAYLENPFKYSEFGPSGSVSIPTKHGQRVKQLYLKRLLRAFAIVDERMSDDEQRS